MILGLSLMQFVLLVLFLVLFTIGGSGVMDWGRNQYKNFRDGDKKGIILGFITLISGFSIGFGLSLALNEYHSVWFGILLGLPGVAFMQVAWRKLFAPTETKVNIPEELFDSIVESLKNKISKG
ncbi:MAG: hypothetical protein LBD46_04740 [Endomicrobium sp.]|jgi:hypothetical protein|nr:hypothetical protein [Endomicrobium sp.]